MRPLTGDDLDWALDVLAARRARLEPYAPLYWRRARDARERHAEWLGAHLDGRLPGAFALRTDRAVIFGTPRADGVLVLDDLAAEEGASEGELESLLREVLSRSGRVRLVCPTPERGRADLGRRLGLELVESWWHRALPEAAVPEPLGDVEGAEARLVEAPPVYDPGGPVLFVTEVADAAALARAEAAGSAAGGVLTVVRQAAGDDGLGAMLTERGYVRHCDFLER